MINVVSGEGGRAEKHIVRDLGLLTFGMTVFLKTCNRSSVPNTGPRTVHGGV